MLKKLYEKSELWFALAWIIAYVVLASIGDNVSTSIGVSKLVTLPILIALSVVVFFFVKKNGLMEKYGLCKPQVRSAKMLFYIPLVVLLTANLWYGVAFNASPVETLLYILSMFCVGFLEEMIFRGFLFNAMAKNGVKSAIIVSSVTFGIGHMVNLINGSGAELLPNLLQVVYAVAVGFAFMMIYFKSKSLLPCIITHSVFNGLSAFSNEGMITPEMQMISGILIAIIAGGYAVYIAWSVKEKDEFNKSKPNQKSSDMELQQALLLSRNGKHVEAYPIFEELYHKNDNATNAFNLFQCAVYCGKTEEEKELYEKLKCYSPNFDKEPVELSGCFVRCNYGFILCDVNRNNEAVEIVEYLLDVLSHYKITDPTFLYIRGIPNAQMIYELIKKTFVEDEEKRNEYKNKLVSLLDHDTKIHEFKE